jgi:hypothetical protein
MITRSFVGVVVFGVFLSLTSAANAQQNVTWINVTSTATVTGNSIQKTGGCEGCNDAGGVSQQQLASGTGYVQLTAASGRAQYVGLTHTTTTPLTASVMDYTFYLSIGNLCEIREFGAYIGDCPYVPGDVLKVAIEAGPVVKYYRNGVFLRTSSTAPNNYPYVLGTDLLSVGAAVNNAQISTAGAGGGVPTSYTAIADRDPRAKPALPVLGAAGSPGSLITDPTFGMRIRRVTDGQTRPGSPNRSFMVSSAAHQATWNKDSTYFYIISRDGSRIPYAFNSATMTASRLQPSQTGDGGLMITSQALEPQFSFVSPNILYGNRQDGSNDWPVIQKFDFSTLGYMDLLNLGSVASISQHTYAGAISSSAASPEKLCVMFGGNSQDLHFKAAVFQVSQPTASVVVLDSVASTITAGGITTNTNIVLNFHLHHAWIDQGGRYVLLYPTGTDLGAPRYADHTYVWDTSTNTIVNLPENTTHSSGHDATGYGYLVNHNCCTSTDWDAFQFQFRSLSAPTTTYDLINPILTPKETYLDDHNSWNNAQPDVRVPILSSTYRAFNDTDPWRAWDDEIVAIQTSNPGSAATVWRFAHHRSKPISDACPTSKDYFWYQPNAVISQDGRWALLTSNWEKQLGSAADSETSYDCGGQDGVYRTDVFVVELK